MQPTDEQLKKITSQVTKLETDIKDMNDSISDLQKGQKSIEILLENIENALK